MRGSRTISDGERKITENRLYLREYGSFSGASEMIILTVDEIIEIHSLIIKKTGGLDGLREKGLLESAVFSISSGF